MQNIIRWNKNKDQSRLTKVIILSLFIGLSLSCSKESSPTNVSTASFYNLQLSKRSGNIPTVPSQVPHQQLDQNSPENVLEELKSFLFSLDKVEEKDSRSSFPSARGAYINSDVDINNAVNREFTHIHLVPGPGSQHLTLSEKDFLLVEQNGWGIKHPWSDQLSEEGYELIMIYAPRNDSDLEEIKKIILAAYYVVLNAT